MAHARHAPVVSSSGSLAMLAAIRDTLTARPISARAPAETSALDGNPIEHGNIQVFEAGGQSRHWAMGLRQHDLRMREHGG
jgi:hypothetical protein